MTAPTHLTFAEFIYLLILTTTGVSLSFVNALAVGIASLLPDIDTRPSILGRMFPSLSLTIERNFGHRTITHSGICVLGIAAILSPILIWNKDLYVCICAGYLTHLFIDTMTINGVKLFYPFSSARCVFPLEVNHPGRYRVQTGSRIDRVLGVIFLIGCAPTLFIAAEGYERFIRTTQKNIESAVRDYNEFSRTNLVYADINAHDLLTKERMVGRFEVIGSLNNRTLLFRGSDRKLHSLGNEYQSDYVAENVVCQKGVPIRVSVRQVDMENQPLMQIQQYVDPARENQFFGRLSASEPFAVPQDGNEFSPITGSGGTIKLNYALYDDIRDLGLENLLITRGILTVRTIMPDSATSDTTPPFAPLPGAEFVPISFQVNLREPIEFLCGKGDSVESNQLLARWGTPVDTRNKIELNLRKIDMLGEETVAKISEIGGKIAKAAIVLEADSLEFETAKKLEGGGYSVSVALEKAKAKYRASRMVVTRLRSSRLAAGAKYEIQMQKLRNENEQLITKQKATNLRSEVRSSARGIIADIRQSVHIGKMLVTILIKRK